MAKIGDDVIEWKTDQLVQWLQQEGMTDCIEPFEAKRLNGRTLVNLSEFEIKSLHHVSHDSKKKLIKSIEKFKRKKKEKMERLFGGGQQVHTRKPPSSCQEDDGGGSDDEGWDSEEWDTDGSQDASSESGGDYLEPEEDLSKGGSLGRESVSVPSGLVAQLRAGIASSFSIYPVAPNKSTPSGTSYEDDEDIYDVPPDEEELYDEPSDSSGGAVVVRPSPNKTKPPKAEEKGEYLLLRGMEEQDTYEIPLQEEDLSPQPPSRLPKPNRFIPTKVAQGNKFVPVLNNNINNNNATYDVPDLEEDSYEIPGQQPIIAAVPPRPPKKDQGPMKPPKPSPSQKPLPGKPQTNIKGPQHGTPGHQHGTPGHQHGTPGRFQGPTSTPPPSSSLTSRGTPFRSQPPPLTQSKLGGRPPPEQRKPGFLPKKAAPPTNPTFSGGQGSLFGRGPPVETVAPLLGPRPVPRGGLLNKTPPHGVEKPPTESPSPHARVGDPLPPPSHRKQASLPTDRPPPPGPIATPPAVESVSPIRRNLPTVPYPSPVKAEAVPPRPPKKGQPVGNQQPILPPRQALPLPTPPVPSSPSFQNDFEQSSASSIESTSADEPIIALQHLPKSTRRGLPAIPPTQTKGPIDMMKEAPWFQGPVDRKVAEANLKKLNKDGSFLVRNSTKSPDDYSMSLIYNRNVRHLRIPHKNHKYVLGDSGIQKFDSIIDLVNYYRQNELDLKTGGKTKLTIPCQVYNS